MIFGAIVGFVVGLVPLILGFTRKNIKFGVIGFVLSIVGGTFFSLLGALPISAVFSWLALRKPKFVESVEAENSSDTQLAKSDIS